jgi:hypothetical protein
MTWRELNNFLLQQRESLRPRSISDFALHDERLIETFERVERIIRESLNEAVRKFSETKVWPKLSEEQTAILYYRLGHGFDLAAALAECASGLFHPAENQDAKMIQWALNETWVYPGLPLTLRGFPGKRRETILDKTIRGN